MYEIEVSVDGFNVIDATTNKTVANFDDVDELFSYIEMLELFNVSI